MVGEDGGPKFKEGYKDYLVSHERMEGIGPLAGWRGEGKDQGRGAPNPDQLDRYIENDCFWAHKLDKDQLFYRHSNKSYLEYAKSMGWVPDLSEITLQLYVEPMQKFRLAAEGHGDVQPPEGLRNRVKTSFDPLPDWYAPFEEARVDEKEFPLHAVTQRPMHMYHSWGSQNAWLRQITNQNKLYMNRKTAAKKDITDGDWVWVESFHGRVKAEVKLMSGVNADTVWTWNAIGKRKGAWGLSNKAPEANKGFLLNHIISDLLPKKGQGRRLPNADPITGQAAWYDLRVKVTKCDKKDFGATDPQQPPLPRWAKPLKLLQFGKEFKK
jgi:anaerobic selenocysteine-containing dehydrogenase